MKIKTNELTGAALDWAVASAKGYSKLALTISGEAREFLEMHSEGYHNYSTDWSQGGPIIEREGIKLTPRKPFHDDWEAEFRWPQGGGTNAFGPTLLIAAMRCYVASKLGDEVEVPEELK